MRGITSLAAWTSLFALGCASAGAPPGGPEDHAPPQVVAISPDSGETNVKIKSAQFTFDEVVSDIPVGGGGKLDQIFLISPRNGAAQVSWHRSKITVRPRNGFRANTAYRVTLLPGLADLRGNVRKEGMTILFSTGPTFPPFSIVGRVFDWSAERPANGAYVEAISKRDTSLAYITATDTAGNFDVGPLDSGAYLVRAIIDQNKNRVIDRGEKWDTLSVAVTTFRPTVELDAIERDSVPPTIDGVAAIDSVNLRVTFDKPIDPALPLQPALIKLQRADSTQLDVTKLQWGAAFDRARQILDSTRRADSLRVAARIDSLRADSARARGDTTRPRPRPTPPPPPTPAPGGRNAPPPPKPKAPPPDRVIIVTVSPTTPFVPGRSYRITARGFRNLVGNAQDVSRTFTVPVPAPTDTTIKRPPPADSTKRPPATSPPVKRPR